MNKNKIIKIKDKQFLEVVSSFLNRDISLDMSCELSYILKSKKVGWNNIQNIFSYLDFNRENQIGYFYDLKDQILLKNKSPYDAAEEVEQMIYEDEYLYDELWNYLTPDIMDHYRYSKKEITLC